MRTLIRLGRQDKDVLADLQSCLYYYENVAESNGDAQRKQNIKANREKLAGIIARIQEEAKCWYRHFLQATTILILLCSN